MSGQPGRPGQNQQGQKPQQHGGQGPNNAFVQQQQFMPQQQQFMNPNMRMMQQPAYPYQQMYVQPQAFVPQQQYIVTPTPQPQQQQQFKPQTQEFIPQQPKSATPTPVKNTKKKESKALKIFNPDTKVEIQIAKSEQTSVNSTTPSTPATPVQAPGTPKQSRALKITAPSDKKPEEGKPEKAESESKTEQPKKEQPKKEQPKKEQPKKEQPTEPKSEPKPAAVKAEPQAAAKPKAKPDRYVYPKELMLKLKELVITPPADLDVTIVPRAPEQKTQSGSNAFALPGMAANNNNRPQQGGRTNSNNGRDFRNNNNNNGGRMGQNGQFNNQRNNSGDNNFRNNSGRNNGRNSNGDGRSITLPPREAVKKLEAGANSWSTNKAKSEKSPIDKAKAILNKLTLEKFDQLSKGILDLLIADLEHLIVPVTEMLFGKAVDEPFFSVVYAKLCAALSSQIKDDGTVNFKKVLLNQCQKQFERASMAEEAQQKKQKEDEQDKDAKAVEEKAKVAKMSSTELKAYEFSIREEAREAVLTIARTKRHVLGNITFIGELYKEDMVPDKIMYYCINMLFDNAKGDGLDANLEQLCKLLDTAGDKLEKRTKIKRKNKAEAKKAIDTWEEVFEKLRNHMKSAKNSRIKFGLQDVLDLRSRNWVARIENKGPKTIAEIHKKAQQEQNQIKMNDANGPPAGRNSRGRDNNQRQGYGRQEHQGNQWSTVNARKEKVDSSKMAGLKSLSGLGGLGGSGGLGGLGNRGLSLGGKQKGSSKNMYSALSDPKKAPKQLKPTSSPMLAKKPIASKPQAPTLLKPDDALGLKITGGIKEYLQIKDVKEIELSVKEWNATYQNDLVFAKFVNTIFEIAFEAKDSEREGLGNLVLGTVGKTVPAVAFVKEAKNFFECLADLEVDVPKAAVYFGDLLACGVVADSQALPVVATLGDKASQDLLNGIANGGYPGELPLKVFLASMKKIKTLKSEAEMMKTVAAVNLTLTELIPLSRDGKPDSERVADLCDRQGLQSLTAVDVVTPIVALIKAKKSSDDVLQHIGKAVSDADSKSPSFINDLTTAIITGITSTVETDGTKSPDAKQTAAEKAAVEQYSPVLKKLCHLNSTLQLHVLCSIQTFAHKHSQPMGLVDRWFEYMYDEDVVEELAFDNYKKDSDVSKSSPYEGKNQALKLADAMYTRLAQPEEPDDEDKA